MTAGEKSRILFCDFDGNFEFSEPLREVGYLVDQIRPESLRSVTVGDHAIYVFSFEKLESTNKVLKICEKLKAAELLTPILLFCRGAASPDFLNHQSQKQSADAYVTGASSPASLLDQLDEMLGLPYVQLNGVVSSVSDDDAENEEVEVYRQRIALLESELIQLKEEASSLDKALEAQRNFYKPKLKAALEGQKLQVQSETERLKVKLSEIEARLLEREARVKELEQSQMNQTKKLQALSSSHKKAQESLRGFYQKKLRDQKKSFEEKLQEKGATTEVVSKTESS